MEYRYLFTAVRSRALIMKIDREQRNGAAAAAPGPMKKMNYSHCLLDIAASTAVCEAAAATASRCNHQITPRHGPAID